MKHFACCFPRRLYPLFLGSWAFPFWQLRKAPRSPRTRPTSSRTSNTWNPDASPNGPVGIIVDLTNQMFYVYRNGKQIGRSAISTGIKSHPTAPGSA